MLLVDGDPDCRSAGSFFKNPVVSEKLFQEIAARCGAKDPPRFPAGSGPENAGRVKIPAAWLIEQAGFAKGYAMGAAGISTRHTLALVNLGDATAARRFWRWRRRFAAAVESQVRRFGWRWSRCWWGFRRDPSRPNRRSALCGQHFFGRAERSEAAFAQAAELQRRWPRRRRRRAWPVRSARYSDGAILAGARAARRWLAPSSAENGSSSKSSLRPGCEGPSQGHALRLAAGEILRTAVSQLPCIDECKHLVDAMCASGAVEAAQPKGHIGRHAEVREERGLLRDKRGLAMAGRQPQSAGRCQ